MKRNNLPGNVEKSVILQPLIEQEARHSDGARMLLSAERGTVHAGSTSLTSSSSPSYFSDVKKKCKKLGCKEISKGQEMEKRVLTIRALNVLLCKNEQPIQCVLG